MRLEHTNARAVAYRWREVPGAVMGRAYSRYHSPALCWPRVAPAKFTESFPMYFYPDKDSNGRGWAVYMENGIWNAVEYMSFEEYTAKYNDRKL